MKKTLGTREKQEPLLKTLFLRLTIHTMWLE